jgi:uncharacterized membrane protein YfcA
MITEKRRMFWLLWCSGGTFASLIAFIGALLSHNYSGALLNLAFLISNGLCIMYWWSRKTKKESKK